MIQSFRGHFEKLVDNLPVFPDSNSRLSLSLIATLLLLVVVPPSLWYVEIAVTILGIYAIVFHRWRESHVVWLIIFTLLMFECYHGWFAQDNHKYLISYWCLAISLAFLSSKPEDFLRNNAKTLIGLCFLFAVIAKLGSVTYMDSTFFQSTLLFDERFRPAAENVIGIDEDVFNENTKSVSSLVGTDGPEKHLVQLVHGPRLRTASWLLTIWTLVIETLIAVAFLVPLGTWFSYSRNFLLSMFIVSTYAVANVIGFGWILAILGIAQLRDNEKYFASVYFLLIVLLHVYRIPWSALVE